MAVVAGCQEVQGACLEGCLGKACGGFGGFGGFAGLRGLRAGKRQQMAVVAGCKVGGFGGFEGFEGLNPKNRWPWWLAARLAEREAAERCARQDPGQCEGHGDKAGSTPPVVPGAAPALAKAGVGGYHIRTSNDKVHV